jgi:hypothetical protein
LKSKGNLKSKQNFKSEQNLKSKEKKKRKKEKRKYKIQNTFALRIGLWARPIARNYSKRPLWAVRREGETPLLCSNPCGSCTLPQTRMCFRGGLLGRGPIGTIGSFFFLSFSVSSFFFNKSDYFWIFFYNVKICKSTVKNLNEL